MQRGFRLARASLEVLRSDKQLMVLPVVSTLAILVFSAAVLSPAFIAGMGAKSNRTGLTFLLIVVYFVSTFIATFSNAAIVAAATERMDGRPGRAVDGLRTAWTRVDRIIAWSAISATVGLILRAAEQRGGVFGAIVGRIAGVAWGVVTFFVVPVIVYEPVGPIEAVKRSASLFKQRWGEQFVGNASIGLAIFVVAIPIALLCAIVASVAVPLAIVLGVLAFGTLLAAGAALSAIFNAALYRYATVGSVPEPFSIDDLQGAFRPRRTGSNGGRLGGGFGGFGGGGFGGGGPGGFTGNGFGSGS
jgi:hypothetical protein